jgi:hypothetical protein
LPSTINPPTTIQAARVFLAGLVSSQPDVAANYIARQKISLPWLCAQGLAPLTWYAVRNAPAQSVPANLAAELRMSYYTAVAQAEQRQRESRSVLETLASQNVNPVVFKGGALAHTVYPDHAYRPMGDLDLWVTNDEMPRAQAALEQIGYVRRTKSTRPLALMQQHNGEIQMVGQQPGKGLIELHWGTFAGEWLQRTARVEDADIRARAVPVTLAGQPALTLAPEDGIIQAAIHFAINHQLSAPWLRALVDIALMVRAQPVDWDVIVTRARAWRVGTAMWLVLKLAVELTGLDEAAPAVAQLSPSPLRRRLLDRLANARSVVELHDMTRRPMRFVYQLMLVDRVRDAAWLFLRTLWPERHWLAARYGQASLAAQFRHLAGALRGKL